MKICKKCGSSFSGNQCKVCKAEYMAGWRKRNSEHKKEYDERWRTTNPEKYKQCVARWATANPEKKKASYELFKKNNPNLKDRYAESRAEYRKEHAQEIKNRNVEYSLSHSEQIRIKVREWRKANPDAVKRNDQTRRARKSGSGGVLSKGLAEKLFILQKGKCACCGKPLGDNYHMDHIMPLVRGGRNEDSNIQLLRQRCNNQKHAKHPVDFMQERGFLL